MINIEKNIPIPLGRHAHSYPFEQMEVGDSFEISPQKRKSGLAQSARSFAKCQPSSNQPKFTLRCSKTEDTVRIWRVA